MRGIIGHGTYVPYRRLDMSTVADVAGGGGRKGTRAVASYDEDATTLAVEASRAARRLVPDAAVESVWFATVSPPYLDKTNATAIHAALRLPEECGAYDVIGSVRGAMGALRAAATQTGPALAVAADVRTGLAGGPDEAYFGDGAAALIIGDETDGPVVAELGTWVSLTDEFVDRWRRPSEERSRVWEERFGEVRYGAIGSEALSRLFKSTGIGPDDVDHLIVTGTHSRACRAVVQRSGVPLGSAGGRPRRDRGQHRRGAPLRAVVVRARGRRTRPDHRPPRFVRRCRGVGGADHAGRCGAHRGRCRWPTRSKVERRSPTGGTSPGGGSSRSSPHGARSRPGRRRRQPVAPSPGSSASRVPGRATGPSICRPCPRTCTSPWRRPVAP